MGFEVTLCIILPIAIILLPIVIPIVAWYYVHRRRRNYNRGGPAGVRVPNGMALVPVDSLPVCLSRTDSSNQPWVHSWIHSCDDENHRDVPSINLVSPPSSSLSLSEEESQESTSPQVAHSVNMSVLDITANARRVDNDPTRVPHSEVRLADGSRLIVEPLPQRTRICSPIDVLKSPQQVDDSSCNSPEPVRTQHSKVPLPDRLEVPNKSAEKPTQYKPTSLRRKSHSYA